MNSDKKIYFPPTIETIRLDNEISLQLESSPDPTGWGDEVYNTPHYFNNDPFKTNVG